MNSREEERRTLPWVWLAALLLTLPCLGAIFWPKLDISHFVLLVNGVGMVLLPCLLPISVRRVLFCLLPLAALAPVAAVYQLLTHSPPTEWTLVALMETSFHEIGPFLPTMSIALILSAGLTWLYWMIVTHKIPVHFRLGWRGRIVIVALGLLMPAHDLIHQGWRDGWAKISRRNAEIYPANLITAGWGAHQMRSDLDKRSRTEHHFTATTDRVLPAGQRQIHILVVGETARADSFQINGYARDTTPLLSANPHVISFQDVSSGAPCTVLSVPLLLTPASAPKVAQAMSMPSSLNVFKKAGYHVHWVSTQQKHGPFATTVSAFSQDADDTAFIGGKLDLESYGSGNPALDSELLPKVREILDKKEERVFLVLHTMGSHARYTRRYPASFNHFPADPAICEQVNTLTELDENLNRELVNAYDNTVRYTDYVLAQLIEMLEAEKAVSTLVYVSDHGENMGDEKNGVPFAHGTLTKSVLHVPLIAWASPEFRELYPAQVAALRSHVNTPFSSDTTFHLLLDLAGIQSDLHKPDQSAANPDFKPAPRKVAFSLAMTGDYDTLLRNLARTQAGH